jgi:hypothetical protein
VLGSLAQGNRAARHNWLLIQRRSGVVDRRPVNTYDPTMTIVTNRPPKRPAKPAQAATIKVPRIVQHTPKGRAWKRPPDDPEAKARAVAFLERMGIKRREEQGAVSPGIQMQLGNRLGWLSLLRTAASSHR